MIEIDKGTYKISSGTDNQVFMSQEMAERMLERFNFWEEMRKKDPEQFEFLREIEFRMGKTLEERSY